MKIDWTTDSTGMMRGFSYHDSSLIGLELFENRYLRLTLSTPESLVKLELADLDTVTLEDVWNVPIVSDIFAWPVGAVPTAVWDNSDGPWYVLLSGRTRDAEKIKAEAARIIKRRPEAFLVQILSSYGGTIAAVCEKISVWTEGPAT